MFKKIPQLSNDSDKSILEWVFVQEIVQVTKVKSNLVNKIGKEVEI